MIVGEGMLWGRGQKVFEQRYMGNGAWVFSTFPPGLYADGNVENQCYRAVALHLVFDKGVHFKFKVGVS